MGSRTAYQKRNRKLANLACLVGDLKMHYQLSMTICIGFTQYT